MISRDVALKRDDLSANVYTHGCDRRLTTHPSNRQQLDKHQLGQTTNTRILLILDFCLGSKIKDVDRELGE